MSLYDEAANAFAEIGGSTILGETCTLETLTVTAIFSAEQADSVFADFSNRDSVTRTAFITRAQLPSKPVDRSILTKGTTNYYIARIDETPTHWLLYLHVAS